MHNSRVHHRRDLCETSSRVTMEETGVLTDGESDGDEGPTEYDVAAQQAPKWYNNHLVALLWLPVH